MATLQDLEHEEGQQIVLTIYENFYWMRRHIIEMFARWILRREDVDGKLELVEHAWEEARQMKLLKQAILDLGYDWDKLDHESYFFEAVRRRYRELMASEDEFEMLVGMNLFSKGTIGYTELDQLYDHSPEIFTLFPGFRQEEGKHTEIAKQRLLQILEKKPELRPNASKIVERYRTVGLEENRTDPQLAAFVKVLIEHGFIGEDAWERAMGRLNEVFGDLPI